MTERDITGDAKRSAYRKTQAIAKERGLLDSDLRTIADGVREFDAQRSPEARTLAALEKLAANTTPEGGSNAAAREFEERRLRRREVLAQELAALALLADDEDAVKIKQGFIYRRLFARFSAPDAPIVADTDASA